MFINPGVRHTQNAIQLENLKRLAPTRAAEVARAYELVENEALNDYLRTQDQNDPTIALLLDRSLRDAVLAETAGLGYKKIVDKPKGMQLEADRPTEYSNEEQDLIDLISLKRELDYEESGYVHEIDQSDPVYQAIDRFVRTQLMQGGINQTAKGGIQNIKHKEYGYRHKHPDLPELTQENAIKNAVRQLYDNIKGNERAEQPSGMMMKTGKMTGIPVEHKLDFQNHPQLGYHPLNRMLGSTFKNSVVRDEQSPKRRQVLLNSAIAQKETDIENKYNMPINEFLKKMNYEYSPLQKTIRNKMAGSEEAREYINLIEKSKMAAQAGQDAVSGGRVAIKAEPGSRVYIHTNGKNGNAEMQEAFSKSNGK